MVAVRVRKISDLLGIIPFTQPLSSRVHDRGTMLPSLEFIVQINYSHHSNV